MTHETSRRTVLAGLGALGALATGGAGIVTLTGGRRTFAESITYAAGDAVVRLEWDVLYNGGLVVTDAGERVRLDEQPDGPFLALHDVKPGDSGSLLLRVILEDDQLPARIVLGAENVRYDENGINEPESNVDVTPDAGELQDAISATLSYDTRGTVLADGSLADVVAVLAEGLTLTTNQLGEDEACFDMLDQVTLRLDWALDVAETNVLQTDLAAFDLTFDTTTCAQL